MQPLNPPPTVSVVMAVHNAKPFLSEAIESILEQTFRDFEFLIIDDGSNDGSTDILKRFAKYDSRIKLFFQDNKGLTKSLNIGLNAARGKYIARMDADDISLRNRFSKQVATLDDNENLVMVGSNVEIISEEGIKLGSTSKDIEHDNIRRSLLAGDGSSMVHPVVMFRRKAVQQIKGYDEDFSVAQDLDLFLRMSEIGLVRNLPETLLLWRQHGNSINRTQSKIWKTVKPMAIEKALLRIGPKQFADEMFRHEKEFFFPQSHLDLGKFALKNNRFKSAVLLFLKAFKERQTTSEGLISLLKTVLVALYFYVKIVLKRF